jgi:LacI family transcriptional regulator
MSKATIAILAREAGVSVATVDRVLNGRLKVREETALKVHEAARRINYYGANAIRSRILADLPEMHFGIILQKERHDFYRDFANQVEQTVLLDTKHRLRATVRFAQSTMPTELAELMSSMAGKVNAVAATGIDHPLVTKAVSDLRLRGIPTFSLLSDFAQGVRESYIGLNNLKVGRTVGWLISKIAVRPGKVGVFIGAHRYHGHELRETGLRSFLRQYAPDFELLNPQINLETRDHTYETTHDLLGKNPDLVGLYCAGGGMEGTIKALRESRNPGEIALIVNELTDVTRQALQDRTVSIVVATPVRHLCDELISLMVLTAERGMADTPGQRFLPFDLWTPESL